MKNLLLALALIFLAQANLFAQQSNNSSQQSRTIAIIAGCSKDTISLSELLAHPVVTIENSKIAVGTFEFSWVSVINGVSEYQGSYIIQGNTLNGIALEQLKYQSENQRITKAFIENVKGIAKDGTNSVEINPKAYRVAR